MIMPCNSGFSQGHPGNQMGCFFECHNYKTRPEFEKGDKFGKKTGKDELCCVFFSTFLVIS